MRDAQTSLSPNPGLPGAAVVLLCLLLPGSASAAAETTDSAPSPPSAQSAPSASSAQSADSSPCPRNWQGEYEWDEFAPALSGANSYWSYSLRVFEDKGNCQARVEGDGAQMKRRILADVRGDEHEIAFIYRKMLPDAGFGSAGEPGDKLFRLQRAGEHIITHWETIRPQLEEHDKPDVYFRPLQARPGVKP